jgi:hypothetical protein
VVAFAFFTGAATAATAATATGVSASDFLETFFTAGVEVEAALLIVFIPVEVFDIFKRVIPLSLAKYCINFYGGRAP